MRVLGIDPGTAIVGFGVIDYEESKFKVVDYGCFYTDKDNLYGGKTCQIYEKLGDLIKIQS